MDVDANELVSLINPRDSLHERAYKLLTECNELVASKLVVVELYSVYSRTMRLGDVEVEALVRYTLRKAGVRDVDWNTVLSKASLYANKLKLKTPDLLHVIASHLIGASSMITFDEDIKNKAETIKENCR